MTKQHEQWLYFADQDLAFAKAGLRDGFYAHVCFLSQQAVEKTMKGYLVFQGKIYPKTHGLITLHRLMSVDWLDEHLTAIKILSEFYVPLRYPDTLPGAFPTCLPGKDDAENALAWATDIATSIRAHIT
jgi:HEPN domain-containing protein